MYALMVPVWLGLLWLAPGAHAEVRLVDLTHPFSGDSVYWPTAPGFELREEFVGMAEHGFYSAYSFCAAEHGGTHIDAPVHFAKGKHSVDEIPLERLIAPGIVVDVSPQVGENADYRVGVADLERWEADHGPIPAGTIVLLRTGWGRFYPDRARYLGTDERGDAAVAKLHFPGLDPRAAQWLVQAREIAAIGLDTPSIDYGQSSAFRSHHILFEAQIPAFENVANLDRLPATGFQVIALPMKIAGGSGGPLRIVALVSAD